MNNLKFLKFTSTDRIWFFSDPHFGHGNICIGTTNWQGESRKRCREFTTSDEMDNTIIQNLNDKVLKNDILICLGDWCFSNKDKIKEYRDKINCKTLHLLLGNHDKEIRNSETWQKCFTSVRDYLELNIDDHHVILQHFPIESWHRMHRGSFHLFGHQHLSIDRKLKNGKKLDVGLDGNDMQPYSWSDVYELLKDREIVKDF